jgi:hypothetical protein
MWWWWHAATKDAAAAVMVGEVGNAGVAAADNAKVDDNG